MPTLSVRYQENEATLVPGEIFLLFNVNGRSFLSIHTHPYTHIHTYTHATPFLCLTFSSHHAHSGQNCLFACGQLVKMEVTASFADKNPKRTHLVLLLGKAPPLAVIIVAVSICTTTNILPKGVQSLNFLDVCTLQVTKMAYAQVAVYGRSPSCSCLIHLLTL
jgi:hypothetical protein